jgi:hypothetical protein
VTTSLALNSAAVPYSASLVVGGDALPQGAGRDLDGFVETPGFAGLDVVFGEARRQGGQHQGDEEHEVGDTRFADRQKPALKSLYIHAQPSTRPGGGPFRVRKTFYVNIFITGQVLTTVEREGHE